MGFLFLSYVHTLYTHVCTLSSTNVRTFSAESLTHYAQCVYTSRMKAERMQIRLPAQLKAQIKLYAKRHDMDMSDIMREAAAEWLAARDVHVETVQLGERFGRNSAPN